MYYEYTFLLKLIYDNNKFLHNPTYTYNVVMWLLKIINIVEHR